jgi:MSHA biogenesis protein MshL
MIEKHKHLTYFIIVFLVFITSCSTTTPTKPGKNTSFQQMQADIRQGISQDKPVIKKSPYVPGSVRKALLPTMTPPPNIEEPAEHRFDVSADKIPAKSFFMGLIDGTPYNMVVNPNVTGTISLELKNVTLEETMDAVRDVYGYEYKRTSYGYEVSPPQIESRIFAVNYLDVKRNGKSLTEMTNGEIAAQLAGSSNAQAGTSSSTSSSGSTSTTQAAYVPTSVVDTTSQMNFWKSLEATLKSMITPTEGRSVVVNSQAGIVIVHAYPNELHQMARYLDRIQSSMNRQVILVAKILEVQLNDQFQSGVNWNLFGKGLVNTPNAQVYDGGMNQISSNTFEGTDLQDFNGIFAVNIKGNFGALIKLLQTQGNVQVLSSPRISTVNNQKAVIKAGEDEFFVTGVSSSTTVAGNSTIPTQNVTLTPFFSGITLDVTPQISSAGIVILHIHPSVSLVKTQQKTFTVGTVIGTTSSGNTSSAPNTMTLPLALSDIRESDNIVRAKNKQIIVIGGLMRNNMSETIAGTPVLSKIPFLGALFRRTQQVSIKTELVILLQPIIIERKAWQNDLEKTNYNFNRLKRGYHVGGLSEVFGTEGEREDGEYDTIQDTGRYKV